MTTISQMRLMFAIVAVCLAVAVSAESPQEGDVEFSEAETVLWMTDQLNSVTEPLTLTYHFERDGTLEPGFTDSVVFVIDKLHDDGMKSAHLNFFTGERKFQVPPAERTNVNPVIKVYLQGDVYEMNRLTDPDGTAKERWRYFQRRIKFALADTANVEPTAITFEGRDYAAKKVKFSPFVNDPHRQKFDRFADKTYTFIVADALPGYLYSIETLIPDAGNEGSHLVREKLTLQEIAQP